MTKLTPSFTICATLILMGIGVAHSANAAIMTIELSGYISGKRPEFLNTPVKVGDTFSFSFKFDDAEQTYQPYYANGLIYSLINQPITTSLVGWSGTLSDEFARFNQPEGSVTGFGNISSIYTSPTPNPTTFNHKEWTFTSTGGAWFKLVTQNAGNLGYGWWGIGGNGPSSYWDSTNAIDHGFMSITSLIISPVIATNPPVPAAVPEPEAYAMLLAGLGLLGFTARRRKWVGRQTA